MDKKILIVEDNKDIADLIKLHLNDMGAHTRVEHDGLKAWQHLEKNNYDMVILDIMLPSMDGLEILKKIRTANNIYTPVLMLTSRNSEMDRVLGLELGADDYLTKPFGLMELIARVKAIFRRVEAMQNSSTTTSPCLNFNGLRIDADCRQVVCEGKELDLTAKEFDLLQHFASHPGQVFNRIQLLDHVWGYSHDGYEHTVNAHINRLRGKLEPDPRHPRFIKTVWGVGYQFIGHSV